MKASSIRQLEPMRFPLHGVRLIEASAGTGKTWSIAALYVRLVLGHGRDEQGPLMPPQILVLTYTRAATQELRDRIRSRLGEVAGAFRSGEPGDDEFMAGLLEAYPDRDERLSAARRLQVAAEWMDEAAIHTIHAWCQTMLRQHAFDSGSLFDQEVEGDDPALLQQAANDYWRRFCLVDRPPDEGPVKWAPSPEKLLERLEPLLKPGVSIRLDGKPIDARAPSEAFATVKAWQDQCKLALEPVMNELEANRDAIVLSLRSGVDQGFFNLPYKNWDFCAQVFEKLERWREHDDLVSVLAPLGLDALEAKLNKRKKQAHPPEHAWFADLSSALSSLPPRPSWQGEMWAHAAQWVQQRYQSEKRQRNRLDFEDLLHHLDQALAGANGERLRKRILNSFPVALVDEFQDTDPIQYRIFSRVYLPERDHPGHGLFMIGDPKQSIYGFRGADIHTYLAARKDTGEDDRFTLPRNYRSTRAMVSEVNRLFSIGSKNPGGAFGFASPDEDPVPFQPVGWKGREEELIVNGEVATALNLWVQPPGIGKGKVAKKDHQPLMAESTAAHIVELLNGARVEHPATGFRKPDGEFTPLRPADIAVLVSNRFEAALVRQALARREVASVYLSERDSVFDQGEAVDVLAMLEAAANPRDAQGVRNALAVPSLCLDLQELDRLASDEEALEREIEWFMRLGRTWKNQGILAMLRRALSGRDVAPRLMARTTGGERALTNLLHLAELLQAQSIQCEGERALINWLQTEIARENRSAIEDQVIRLESDADLVRIVTIFKSKGLEYPLVFLPFASCYKTRNKGFLEYHDDNGQPVVELGADEQATERFKWEALQGRLRLFYVAMTRARHACWVGLGPVDDQSVSAPGYLLGGQRDGNEESFDLQALAEKFASGSPDASLGVITESDLDEVCLLPEAQAFECAPARTVQRQGFEFWGIASYSVLRHGRLEAEASEAPDNSVSDNLLESGLDDRPDQEQTGRQSEQPARGTIHAFPRGASAGNFIHLVLEWAGREGFARALEKPGQLDAEIGRRLARQGWDDHGETIKNWLQNQLTAPIRLGDTRTRLVDLDFARHQCTPELEFWIQASDVDVPTLDRMVTAHTLGGRPRGPFEPRRIHGQLHGFIDLVFEHHGRWYVADYKSNWIGATEHHYDVERMSELIAQRRYDMQYVFYTLALHRLLRSRLGQTYQPEKHLGGAAFLFVRGCRNPETAGVFFEPANIELIEGIDALFAAREVVHEG